MTLPSLAPKSLTAEAIAPEILQINEITQIPEIDYPDSDGNPMSDNTEQYRWIVMIKENLEIIFADNPNIFVAGDLLWYPVRYTPKRMAPDVMVAFGRPKGRRGSYKQWQEENIPPQVAFEILSPSNKDRRGLESLEDKFNFYETYGIQEYYVYDPDDLVLYGWQYANGRFLEIDMRSLWVSPLLQVRFEWQDGKELIMYRPNGQRFLSPVELDKRAEAAIQRAEAFEQRADIAEQRANIAEQLAEQEKLRADRLAARLRDLGIDLNLESI
jgi:Uma2 family endonuclease